MGKRAISLAYDSASWASVRLLSLLDQHLAVRLTGVWEPDDCRRCVDAVYRARQDWTPAFNEEQFSLGRAWYTDFEQDLSREYFQQANVSDALVERHLPGLQDKMLDLLRQLLGATVERRRGWCGPGVHVFPAGEHVAEHGGVIHFDTEGLAFHHVELRRPALSFILMLQPPTDSGGVRVWDVSYEGEDEVADDALDCDNDLVVSDVGDLVVLDSYRLHQIQPFGGADRVSLTVMAAEVDRDRWEAWF